MLNVKIRVKYEGDWTAELRDKDVFGQFLATTFRNRQYLGVVTLDVASEDCDEVLETIRNHRHTESMEVIEIRETDYGKRSTATIVINGLYHEYTPLQILLYEGYLPYGAFGELDNGEMTYDLLVEDRDSISDAVSLLREFGPVSVDRITQSFSSYVVPSVTEWQSLLSSLPPRQRELLDTALEEGYYDMPREITLKELADEVGVAKTTASQHLRKAERQIVSFVVRYMNLTQPN
ncbi:helix-turn-helix domain-containing protein [Haloferax denitrificans]|uniref:Transcriptional regulator n=1 Tax=Haloferax denitrificans ATCC 35960 TaxID=662478 RepID=M0JCR9_9EURY|nr:helix-turn-helix domain-containing protein [Haloferax denitrificans]EMA06917.1 transcriptional regulator [Haloferax denitrificans ATCC 35960]